MPVFVHDLELPSTCRSGGSCVAQLTYVRGGPIAVTCATPGYTCEYEPKQLPYRPERTTVPLVLTITGQPGTCEVVAAGATEARDTTEVTE